MKKITLSFLVLLFVVAGCKTIPEKAAHKREGSLKNMRVAILVTDGFEQVEMTEPKKALEQAGAEVVIVSPKKDRIQGYHHDKEADSFKVDMPLDRAKAEKFDALLLPGGVKNPDALRMVPDAISFIKEFGKSKKPIAAICHGPWALINAGLVKGHRMTSWPSLAVDLQNAGAVWVDVEVVVSNNLVTSRKPADIPAFNRAMIELFLKHQGRKG